MFKYLRLKQVAKKTGLGKSTIWLWVKENKFPQPIKLSPRVTVWEKDKIKEWVEEKMTQLA